MIPVAPAWSGSCRTKQTGDGCARDVQAKPTVADHVRKGGAAAFKLAPLPRRSQVGTNSTLSPQAIRGLSHSGPAKGPAILARAADESSSLLTRTPSSPMSSR